MGFFLLKHWEFIPSVNKKVSGLTFGTDPSEILSFTALHQYNNKYFPKKDKYLLFINKYFLGLCPQPNFTIMKFKTEVLLQVMNVLAWVVFIGLIIKAGSVIISYGVSIGNAEASKNLYMGMDRNAYLKFSFAQYTIVVGYQVALFIMEAYIAFLMTRLLSKLNIARPFSADVVKLLQQISYWIFWVWLVVMIYNIHVFILEKSQAIAASYISGDFIFLAGIVYVLAQLFKRGIEIQSENELTV